MNNTRVLLGDDHALMLDGIRTALAPHFNVVGQARDGVALIKAAGELRPDVVVLDISMPLLNGFEAARKILSASPSIKVIFLSQHLNPAYLREALQIGASGYVLKSEAAEELQKAVTTALRGEAHISPGFGEKVIASLWDRTGAVNRQSVELSDRQREILQLVLDGRGNKEIAEVLHLSVKTIEFHRGKIMDKLGVRTQAQLAKVALQRGLIPE